MTERDVMETDVLIVGGGPAGLACAIRLKEKDPDLGVIVLEKAAEIGSHSLSGAVLQADALDELVPDWRDNPPAVCVPATRDEFSLMTRKKRIRMLTPPQMANHGNVIISLGSLCQKLAERAEGLGVDVFPGFSGAETLHSDDGSVIGVRAGDMGVEKNGEPGPNFAAGVDIHAGTTVLAEGCRGSLSKQLIARFELDKDSCPQTYALGFKELWQLPEGRSEPGLVQHTVGWPLDNSIYGGSFTYHLDNDRVYIGFVVALDYEDPDFSPFEAFQQFKNHPANKALLEGGEIVSSGARTLIEGGYQSLPKLEMPGALLIGDAAGLLNVPKIKGIHMALRAGMLAADHVAQHKSSEGYDAAWRSSPSARELHKVRNIRPGFHRGLWMGMANAALETITFGKLPWTLKNRADWSALQKRAEYATPERHWGERSLPPRDRLASVYFANNAHDENQPVHLRVKDTTVCATTCAEEYGNPCTRFCPAGVYEMVDDGEDGKRLQINAANCVHCKACDIKDPYEIITWVPPEGGSGPNYQTL
ncbi:MAG: electron transfer flavoprotein-ubiquinone oxidoreductase [Pseudomonadota bacterium]